MLVDKGVGAGQLQGCKEVVQESPYAGYGHALLARHLSTSR